MKRLLDTIDDQHDAVWLALKHARCELKSDLEKLDMEIAASRFSLRRWFPDVEFEPLTAAH